MQFQLIHKLGEGVYGTVWKAVDKTTGEVVAIKQFKTAHQEPHILRLAQREAQLLKAARHPNIVQLRQPVTQAPDGHMFLITEFVDHTLMDHLQGFTTKSHTHISPPAVPASKAPPHSVQEGVPAESENCCQPAQAADEPAGGEVKALVLLSQGDSSRPGSCNMAVDIPCTAKDNLPSTGVVPPEAAAAGQRSSTSAQETLPGPVTDAATGKGFAPAAPSQADAQAPPVLQGLTETSAKLILWQILQGTASMHRARIIHRDLTPSNVLVSASGIVKLCDFGFARTVAPGPGPGAGKYTEYITTRWYRPPELLVGAPYGTPADVWAVGCLFYEMLTGRPLFPGRDAIDQLARIACSVGPLPSWQLACLGGGGGRADGRLPHPDPAQSLKARCMGLSYGAVKVLRGCLHPDPNMRLTAKELLSLSYFDDIHQHTRGTELQQVYDTAYAAALHRGSPSAPCLWACSSKCLEARAFNASLAAEAVEAAAGEAAGETCLGGRAIAASVGAKADTPTTCAGENLGVHARCAHLQDHLLPGLGQPGAEEAGAVACAGHPGLSGMSEQHARRSETGASGQATVASLAPALGLSHLLGAATTVMGTAEARSPATPVPTRPPAMPAAGASPVPSLPGSLPAAFASLLRPQGSDCSSEGCDNSRQPAATRAGVVARSSPTSRASSTYSHHSARDALGSLGLGGLSMALRPPAALDATPAPPNKTARGDSSSGGVGMALGQGGSGVRISKRTSGTCDVDCPLGSAPQSIRPTKMGRLHAYALASSLPCTSDQLLLTGGSPCSEGRIGLLGASVSYVRRSLLLPGSWVDGGSGNASAGEGGLLSDAAARSSTSHINRR